MQSNKKRTFLRGVPSAIQAFILALVGLLILFVLAASLGSVPWISENLGEAAAYLIHGILVAAGCYVICRQNPRSIWYTPLIANVFVFVSAIVEPNFWTTSLYLWFGGSVILSVPASIWGTLMGKTLNAKQ